MFWSSNIFKGSWKAEVLSKTSGPESKIVKGGHSTLRGWSPSGCSLWRVGVEGEVLNVDQITTGQPQTRALWLPPSREEESNSKS